MLRVTSVGVLTMCLLGPPIAADATPIALTNSSFESLGLGDGASSSSLPGWTRFMSVDTFNPTMADFPSEAYDGQNVALFSGGATLTQILGPLAYGTYTLTAAIGDPLGAPLGGLSLSLRRGTTFLSPASTSFTAPADGVFSLITKIYEVTPTNVNGTLFGEIINVFALSSGSGAQVALDDVQLDLQPLEEASAVPEPSSLGLLGVSVFALGIGRSARILVATARDRDAAIVTRDEEIRAYAHVRTVWSPVLRRRENFRSIPSVRRARGGSSRRPAPVSAQPRSGPCWRMTVIRDAPETSIDPSVSIPIPCARSGSTGANRARDHARSRRSRANRERYLGGAGIVSPA